MCIDAILLDMIDANKIIHRKYNCLLCPLVLSISVTTLVYAGDTKTLGREIDPVVIPGEKLPWLMGNSTDKIRVFSFRAGKAVMIPFQIDQNPRSLGARFQ